MQVSYSISPIPGYFQGFRTVPGGRWLTRKNGKLQHRLQLTGGPARRRGLKQGLSLWLQRDGGDRPSRGTAYPAMRRLWIADAAPRPARKYYKLTRSGEVVLEASRKRYPSLAV